MKLFDTKYVLMLPNKLIHRTEATDPTISATMCNHDNFSLWNALVVSIE